MQRRAPIYDKKQDGHYNLISALHKSVRGSDPDAALYYLCRMLDAGEDPLYLARRVVRMAIEDIGLADPQALVVANAAKDAYDFLGSPEGELAIAQAVIYLATAPKSNAAYRRLSARRCAPPSEAGSLLPPKHILNAPTKLMKSEGYGDELSNTTTTRPRPSPARTISPRRSAAGNSTIRPSAASSARSASGWIIGRSCGARGANDRSRRLFPPDRLCRRRRHPTAPRSRRCIGCTRRRSRSRISIRCWACAVRLDAGRAREQARALRPRRLLLRAQSAVHARARGARIFASAVSAPACCGAPPRTPSRRAPICCCASSSTAPRISPMWVLAARPPPAPLCLDDEGAQRTAHEPFRLVRAGDEFVLQAGDRPGLAIALSVRPAAAVPARL